MKPRKENTLSNIKNTLDEINSRLDITEYYRI